MGKWGTGPGGGLGRAVGGLCLIMIASEREFSCGFSVSRQSQLYFSSACCVLCLKFTASFWSLHLLGTPIPLYPATPCLELGCLGMPCSSVQKGLGRVLHSVSKEFCLWVIPHSAQRDCDNVARGGCSGTRTQASCMQNLAFRPSLGTQEVKSWTHIHTST